MSEVYSIVEGFVVLDENSDAVEWFDDYESAEEYICDESDNDDYNYSSNQAFIVLDESSQIVDYFDTFDEAEEYITDVLLDGNFVGVL